MQTTHIAVLIACIAGCTGATRQPRAADAAQGTARAREGDRVESAASAGVPKGYVGRADDPARDVREAMYRRIRNRFEIVSGPAHIVYAAGDTIRGSYAVASTFVQGRAPERADGFGLFVGGVELNGRHPRYTSFLVRGTGEFTVRVHDGARILDIIPWTASPLIPRQDASGRATYRVAIVVGTDSVRFLSGGRRVASIAREIVPAEGIFGIRVGGTLHVTADEVRRSTL